MKKGRKVSGVITVFLSLILCTVLAVVGTGVEVSRVEMGKGMASRAFYLGLESLLGEYSLQIFRRYHLFLLNSGFGSREESEDRMLSHIKEDIENTFSPNRNINQWNSLKLKNFNMLGLQLKDLTITKKKNIMEEEGELFVNEAVNYMKYAMKPEEVEKLIQKLSPFSEMKDSIVLVGESIKAEQNMVGLDRSLMSFIQIVEGLSIKKDQFQFSQNGTLKTEDYFAKSLCTGEVTMSNVGVQSAVVWNSLKNKYSSPSKVFSGIYQSLNEIKNGEGRRENLQKDIEALREVSADSEEAAEKISREVERIYRQIEEIDKVKAQAAKSMKANFSQIRKLLQQVQKKNKEAIEMIPRIHEEQKKFASAITEYESKLNSSKETSDEKLHHQLTEELEQKKAYANGEIPCLSGKKIEEVEIILRRNQQVIEEAEENISGFHFSVSSNAEITEMMVKMNELSQILGQYDTKSLVFSYGDITVKKPENPIDNIKALIEDGILELVVEDVKSLSNKTLSAWQLPSSGMGERSDTAAGHGEKDEFPYMDLSWFDSGSDWKQDIVKTILLGSYFSEHFQMVVPTLIKAEGESEESKEDHNPHALDYELEYLINGKEKDKENLLAVVNRMLLIRTVCNFIYLYTDPGASGKAGATATGLVGFTCFQPLISLTKTLILIAWSFAESFIDICALLQGYTVPFLKKSNEFVMKYEELMSINKSKIREKAERWKQTKSGIEYEEYLQFLLLLIPQKVKCYRALDLIQENTNLAGKENIDMRNALFGIEIRGECSVSMKFLKIPFINRIVGGKGNQYSFFVESETAY